MKFMLRCLLLIALLVLPLSAGANTVCAVHACNEAAESFSSEDESTSLYSSLNMDMLYKTLTVSYADLSIKGVSESLLHANPYRARRAAEYLSAVRDLLLHLSIRENQLVIDRSKLFYSNTSHHCLSGVCDYYVYLLRRILI